MKYIFTPPVLDKRIVLRISEEPKTDAYGREISPKHTDVEVWACVYDRRVSQAEESGTLVQMIFTTFTCRANQQITENIKILFNDAEYSPIGPPLKRGYGYMQIESKVEL